jgi:hypothetical protein
MKIISSLLVALATVADASNFKLYKAPKGLKTKCFVYALFLNTIGVRTTILL